MTDNPPGPGDDGGMPDLPQFESLPAAAGLNKLEVFQLSIQHALALLPFIVAKHGSFPAPPENPERFRLD